jgi:hypothetical protein
MMLLVFLTQPGGPLSKWTSWVQWLSSTSFFSASGLINTRPVMLRIRSLLHAMLEGSAPSTKVYPVINSLGQVDSETIKEVGPTKWHKRTASYDEFGLENIHSNTPETQLALTSFVWRLNELATDAFRSARTTYWGLYSMSRLHTAGTKIPSPIALENAMKALVEADALAGAVPFTGPGALFVRKNDEGSRILVGKWLRRFLMFRAKAQADVVSKNLTVGVK